MDLSLNTPQDLILKGGSFKSSNYRETKYEGIVEGFSISFGLEGGFPNNWGTWKEWANRPHGAIVKNISTEDIKINNNIAYKKVGEGNGFMNEFKETNTLVEIFIPNKLQDKMISIHMLTPSDEYDANVKIFDSIVKSIEWK